MGGDYYRLNILRIPIILVFALNTDNNIFKKKNTEREPGWM